MYFESTTKKGVGRGRGVFEMSLVQMWDGHRRGMNCSASQYRVSRYVEPQALTECLGPRWKSVWVCEDVACKKGDMGPGLGRLWNAWNLESILKELSG